MTALPHAAAAGLGDVLARGDVWRGGTLALHFSSDEELNAFADRILGSNL